MSTREVLACRLNQLALVSRATERWFGNYGGLQLLFSGGTCKTGTRSSCCDICWGPWPVVHVVHGVSAAAPTQAFVCLLQNLHIIIAEKSIPGFLSEVGKSVSRREREKVSVSIFSISVSLKISFNDTHPSVWLQNLKMQSACTIRVTILPSLLKSWPWMSPTPCFHSLLLSWYLKLRSPLHKYY